MHRTSGVSQSLLGVRGSFLGEATLRLSPEVKQGARPVFLAEGTDCTRTSCKREGSEFEDLKGLVWLHSGEEGGPVPGKGGGNQVLKGSSLYPASGGESLLSLKQGLSGSGQSCICKKVTVLHGEEQARCGGGRTETG